MADKTSKVKLKTVEVKRRRLIDPETGEVVEVYQQVREGYKDVNWFKVWLLDFVDVISEIGTRKMKVFEYVIDNLDKRSNRFIGTFDKIQAETKCSKATINAVLQILLKKKVLKRIQSGVYMMDPDLLAYGDTQSRQRLLIEWRQLDITQQEDTELKKQMELFTEEHLTKKAS